MRFARLLLPALLLTASQLAAAQAQYTYTGPTYTTFFAPYTGASRITGNFRLTSGALAANLSSADIRAQVQSFSFTDGNQTRTQADTQICNFSISTNAAGQITGQAIWLRKLAPGIAEQQHNLESYWPAGIDQSGLMMTPGDLGCGAGAQDPFGQAPTSAAPPWTVSGLQVEPPQAIPSLSSWSLAALAGMMMLAGLRRRRN